jgi:hypothetical protein
MDLTTNDREEEKEEKPTHGFGGSAYPVGGDICSWMGDAG